MLKNARAGACARPGESDQILQGGGLGAAVTAIIKAPATTVMVVGFVNSGIMQLSQGIPVVMGANVGTTVTPWILSLTGIQSDNFFMTLLKPSTFSPLLAFVGIIMLMASRRQRDTAGILLGFSVLMFGMEQMSLAVSGLAEIPSFREMLVLFSYPLFGVLLGAVVTAIIQSSSASVGILQALANTGALTYGAALPIIMGQYIGTCITSLVSSIGANRNARRVAMVHLYFNLIGTLLFWVCFIFWITSSALPLPPCLCRQWASRWCTRCLTLWLWRALSLYSVNWSGWPRRPSRTQARRGTGAAGPAPTGYALYGD